MADTEFEELRQCLEEMPQHNKVSLPFYTLVSDILDDVSPTSSKSDEDEDEEDNHSLPHFQQQPQCSTTEDNTTALTDTNPSGQFSLDTLDGDNIRPVQIIQSTDHFPEGTTSATLISNGVLILPRNSGVGQLMPKTMPSTSSDFSMITGGFYVLSRQASVSENDNASPGSSLMESNASAGPNSMLIFPQSSEENIPERCQSGPASNFPLQQEVNSQTQGNVVFLVNPNDSDTYHSSSIPTSSNSYNSEPTCAKHDSIKEVPHANHTDIRNSGIPGPPFHQGTRRRRKLPEIPKSRRGKVASFLSTSSASSLASELASSYPQLLLRNSDVGVDSSPDSSGTFCYATTDQSDSGHSTAHSPIEKSMSPHPDFGGPIGTGRIATGDELLVDATHRGLYRFVPRHRDEVEVEIGDPLYVQSESDDLWCEGVNLRTGRAGIFPSAYAVDTEYSEFVQPLFNDGEELVEARPRRLERYLLAYLGSVETHAHKGTAVVCQATRRVVQDGTLNAPNGAPCVLEVSDRGLRMVERTKPVPDRPCIDYFYSLKNVSFCAFHPRDHRYLGFITKHPTLQRFACHVFRGTESTRPVAEAVGRAFQRFYQKFIETAYPIEDIYIE